MTPSSCPHTARTADSTASTKHRKTSHGSPPQSRSYHGYHHPKKRHPLLPHQLPGRSVVIATDTEGFCGGDRKLINFTRDANLLIHDAEYDDHEYADESVIRQGWGHSTWRMATEVAAAAQVQRLALTHHSPGHNDADLETILVKAQTVFRNTFLAREGETIVV